MYYGTIKKSDIANGIGVRVSLFVSGCTHHCRGCFNEETWDFHYGEPFDERAREKIFTWLKPDYVDGLTVLGGEPFEHVNQQALVPFLEEVKKRYPQKTVWCYTGYVFDTDILNVMVPEWEETGRLLSLIDVLVDGPFVEEKKDITLRFRGSSNQRLIDVKKSLADGSVILYEPRD